MHIWQISDSILTTWQLVENINGNQIQILLLGHIILIKLSVIPNQLYLQLSLKSISILKDQKNNLLHLVNMMDIWKNSDITKTIWQSGENINGNQTLILQLGLMMLIKLSFRLNPRFLQQSSQRIFSKKKLLNNLLLQVNMMDILKISDTTQKIWLSEVSMFGNLTPILQLVHTISNKHQYKLNPLFHLLLFLKINSLKDQLNNLRPQDSMMDI